LAKWEASLKQRGSPAEE